MFSIYLCESNTEQSAYHEDILSKYALINNFPLEQIYKLESLHMLLHSLKLRPPMIGLYYIDVEFGKEMDSFQLAQKIRSIDPRGHLVFLDLQNKFPRYPFEMHLEAMDYITQNDLPKLPIRLTQCLRTAVDNYHNLSNYPYYPNKLILKTKQEIKVIPNKNLIFPETEFQNHKISIHTKDEILSIRGTIKELMKKLDNNIFCQVSQSAIVNILWVASVDTERKQILIKTGECIEYSYRYQGGLFTIINRLQK